MSRFGVALQLDIQIGLRHLHQLPHGLFELLERVRLFGLCMGLLHAAMMSRIRALQAQFRATLGKSRIQSGARSA